jgi:hypothetical protein
MMGIPVELALNTVDTRKLVRTKGDWLLITYGDEPLRTTAVRQDRLRSWDVSQNSGRFVIQLKIDDAKDEDIDVPTIAPFKDIREALEWAEVNLPACNGVADDQGLLKEVAAPSLSDAGPLEQPLDSNAPHRSCNQAESAGVDKILDKLNSTPMEGLSNEERNRHMAKTAHYSHLSAMLKEDSEPPPVAE